MWTVANFTDRRRAAEDSEFIFALAIVFQTETTAQLNRASMEAFVSIRNDVRSAIGATVSVDLPDASAPVSLVALLQSNDFHPSLKQYKRSASCRGTAPSTAL
jgi:hypothetical protein